MSIIPIRAALETALAAVPGALSTAYENAPFTPTPGTPYQACAILFARPINDEISASHVEQGFMQVTLRYPLAVGSAAVAAMAETLRTAFYRGRSLTSGGIVTTIAATPEIMPAQIDADRWAVLVRIRFTAPITA